MGYLDEISQELQHIVEAINAVTGVDITIIDSGLRRVAGTGPLKADIGGKAPAGSAFAQCLYSGRQYLIEHPRRDAACDACLGRDDCREQTELCIPINADGETVGVLGMCAFDDRARNSLMAGLDGYIKLESQLIKVIASVLGAKKYGMLAEYRSAEMTTLVNSLNEGIVIVSPGGEVVTQNNYLTKRLKTASAASPSLRNIVGDKLYRKLVRKRFAGEFGPVRLGDHEYLVNANPIVHNREHLGAVLVLSDFDKMRESVLKAKRSDKVFRFQDIIGESEALLAAKQQAMLASNSDVSIILTGETGTGKEIFARAIHSAGARRGNLFIPVNCSAIPEALLESELFGYEKGAFTGAADTGKLGLFEIAKDGTLFLDEIGELPMAMQAKFLRALEEKEIIRVGGLEPMFVNPRVVAATHRNLDHMVENGMLREDLYYRLNVVTVEIPPLRRRGGDILLLARHFLDQYAALHGKGAEGLTPECERLLMSYDFPGNIRELRNLMEYAVIFCAESRVSAECILPKLKKGPQPTRSLAAMTEDFQREVIENCIHRMGDGIDAKKTVADSLGISLSTLYRRLGQEEK